MQPSLASQPKIRYIIMLALTVLGIGVLFYHHVENLSWIDALYFCVITLATVGYGDITPHTDAGKLFTVFYVIVGIGIFAATVNFLIKHAAIRRMQHLENHKKHKKS